MSTQQIRLNADGTLDEIVIDRCSIHLEQMADNAWWLGINRGSGQAATSLHITLHTTRAPITATWGDEGLGADVVTSR